MTFADRQTTSEIRIRGARRVFVVTLLIGCTGLVLAAMFEIFRVPYAIIVFIAAALVGVVGVFDRRVKLSLSNAGIRYAQWGPGVVPWKDFSAYRRATWRKYPYLQLVPRRPSQLVECFSRVGKLNHRLARIFGIPAFGIAVTPLDILERELAENVCKYLPEKS